MIWFNVEKAAKFLLANRLIFTLRPNLKRDGLHKLRVRKENDRLHVSIMLMREFDMTEVETKEQLEAYVKFSGFGSVDEWISHIPKPTKIMYLYFVRMVDLNDT